MALCSNECNTNLNVKRCVSVHFVLDEKTFCITLFPENVIDWQSIRLHGMTTSYANHIHNITIAVQRN